MRLFFALDLPSDAKAAIADWRDRHAVADGRPVPPANFHITLAFLGELEVRRLERLCDAVDGLFQSPVAAPPPLHLDCVGFWPSPGIFWLGAEHCDRRLSALAGTLNSLAQEFGARRDRRAYVPHVTLYRRCNQPPPAPVRHANISLEFDEITLFESVQGRGSVSYQPLAAWTLG